MNPPQIPLRATQPTFAGLFTPKLFTVLREGYGFKDFQADAVAGLTVAIVALPLSMAIAIGAGLSPERGLYTAIIGGFLVSLLGGSRFQIGGPAAAFIVLIASIVAREGYDGLVLATVIGGALLMLTGFLQLGTFIKYIPYPVTVGFTAGIAVIIAVTQIPDLFGLRVGHEADSLIQRLVALSGALGTVNFPTVAVTVLSMAIIVAVTRLVPRAPAFLIAVAFAAIVTVLLSLDVATIGSRFGGMPSGLPEFSLPNWSADKLPAALRNGVAIALLGAIESLLSAVVADGMTGRRHRSNCELVGQGVANIGSALFGGICVTGTLARTATNIRSGARGPIAGILHSLYLLIFILVAAPLISYIPLAALGAVLVIVAWNMAEKGEFWALVRSSRGDALVLLMTFGLTIFVDLITGITIGVVLGAFLFLHRMAEMVQVEGQALVIEDRPDWENGRGSYEPKAQDRDVMVFRISGAFFFGATAAVSTVLDRAGERPKAFILDFREVPLIDSTAAAALRAFVKRLRRAGTKVYFAGTRHRVRETLFAAGLTPPQVTYKAGVESALASAESLRRGEELIQKASGQAG
jgi:SulP family sulfate permease